MPARYLFLKCKIWFISYSQSTQPCGHFYTRYLLFSFADVNECLVNNGGCDVLCKNTEGSLYCGCKFGYVLSKNGFACEDHNECFTRSHECDQLCVNTEGSYNCFCQASYALDDSGTSCAGENKTGKLFCVSVVEYLNDFLES